MQRNSPRASMGLRRLEASIAPDVAPAPTTFFLVYLVCAYGWGCEFHLFFACLCMCRCVCVGGGVVGLWVSRRRSRGKEEEEEDNATDSSEVRALCVAH